MSKTITYKDSGVDIDKGNELVDRIKPIAKSTNRDGVMSSIGGFGALFDLAKCNYKDPILVSGTDGIGTKLKLAIDAKKYDGLGYDLVAMCVNDIICQGAEPLFFLDYFACSKLDNDVAGEIISSIGKACKESNCALIGGETAEMPGMYNKDDFDIAGFAVGVVERENIMPSGVAKGDVILGVESSGVHSNGYSLVRKIISEYNINLNDKAEFDNGKSYAEALLAPTRLYVSPALEIIKNNLANAFCHITGGGFIENIPRVLPDDLEPNIDYDKLILSPLFSWLKDKANLNNHELYKTFNCGIGLVVILKQENVQRAKEIFSKHNMKSHIIGDIV